MKKNIDYWEGEEPEDEIVEMNALELSELIESKISVPGRKSKAAIKEINNLIDVFNLRYGKVYKRLS